MKKIFLANLASWRFDFLNLLFRRAVHPGVHERYTRVSTSSTPVCMEIWFSDGGKTAGNFISKRNYYESEERESWGIFFSVLATNWKVLV